MFPISMEDTYTRRGDVGTPERGVNGKFNVIKRWCARVVPERAYKFRAGNQFVYIERTIKLQMVCTVRERSDLRPDEIL